MRQVPGYPLWLGHAGDVRELRNVLAAGVRALVDLALNESPVAITRDLIYCRFPLVDGAGNAPWLLRMAIDNIVSLLQARTPTLVFCGAGISRTPCIAAAAIAQSCGLSPAEALRVVVRSGAADVSPALWLDVQAVVGT